MSPEAGLEFTGPYEAAEEIKSVILEAGEEHGIRHLGRKTYISQAIRLGWIPPWRKPVYDSEKMKKYRQWATGTFATLISDNARWYDEKYCRDVRRSRLF